MTNLERIRRGRGQTQPEIANAIGCSTPTICRYERGHSLPNRILGNRLEALCGASVEALLSHDPNDLPTHNAAEPETRRR